jgi:small subunit ribosomal protein S8
MKNYLWNMFSSIKNGQLAKRSFILHRNKKICEKFLKILWNEGFILGYKNYHHKNYIKIFLKYKNGKPTINSLKLITKPGNRIYYSIKQIWKINSNNTFIIFSTNKGLKTIIECKKLKIGGEPYIIID